MPFELIPLNGAAYDQHLQVSLDPSGRATLMEVVGPGLVHERFSYQRLVLQTSVWDADGVVALARVHLTPVARLAMPGHTHYGSLMAFGPDGWHVQAEAAHEILSRREVLGSASTLARGGMIVKVLGSSAFAVREALLAAARLSG